MKYEVLVADMADPGCFYTKIIEVGDLPESELLMLLIAHPAFSGVGYAPDIQDVLSWCEDNGHEFNVKTIKDSLSDCEEEFVLQIYNITKHELYYRDPCVNGLTPSKSEERKEALRRKELADVLMRTKK